MTDQSIYLVRHGETAFNADGRLRGRADPDLNAAGLGQAKSLASAFASAEPSTIVSSPLLRAVQRRRSSPKAARPSTRSTCGSMIRGYGRWARQPNTDVIAQWVHRRRGTGRRADVLDPLASPSSPRRMGRAGASLRSPPDCRHPRRRDQTAPNQHCASPPFAQRGHRLLPTVATPFDDLAHRTGKPASLMPSAAGRQVPARHHFSRHRDRAIGLIRQASGWSLNTR